MTWNPTRGPTLYREFGGEQIDVYVWLDPFAVH